MNDIEWEDPPPKRRASYRRLPADHQARLILFCAELVQHPGKWAVWDRDSPRPTVHFGANVEQTSRGNGGQRYTIYARWIA